MLSKKTYSALRRMKEQLSSFLKKNGRSNAGYLDRVEHLLVYPGKVAEEIVAKANPFGCEAIES